MTTLIFDTETSGLINNTLKPLEKQSHIIEFYGCLCDDEGVIVDELDLLIKPPIPVTKEITKITGISQEMVANRGPFAEYAKQIAEFVNRTDLWVAHNLSYDLQILRFEFQRLGMIVPVKRLLCTVETTEHIKGHRLSLTALHEHLFGEPFKGAHRAKEDVMALKRCYDELRKRGEV